MENKIKCRYCNQEATSSIDSIPMCEDCMADMYASQMADQEYQRLEDERMYRDLEEEMRMEMMIH